ncbi:MAG: Na-translocating system protein MpsC family protein [Chloroflexota bacterium]
MSIAFPTQPIKMQFEQNVLQGWHDAHGLDAGNVTSSWGDDRVIVMIEDALFKGEHLLTQSETGNAVLKKYVEELLSYIANEHAGDLSNLLQRQIISTSFSINTLESWVMFIFRLGEPDGFR